MDISRQEAKLKELEELVEHDEANGKHCRKRLKTLLEESKLCPIKLSKRIEEEIKSER